MAKVCVLYGDIAVLKKMITVVKTIIITVDIKLNMYTLYMSPL